MNGGLNIELAGDRWDGNKLDARTTNGGRECDDAGKYSAHFETGTVNGRLNVDFPMTVHGEIARRLTTDIGSAARRFTSRPQRRGERQARGDIGASRSSSQKQRARDRIGAIGRISRNPSEAYR